MSLGDIFKSVAAPVASVLGGPAGGAIVGGVLGALGSNGSSPVQTASNSTTTSNNESSTTGNVNTASTGTTSNNAVNTSTGTTTGLITGNTTGTGTTSSAGTTAGTATTTLAQQQQIGQLLNMLNGISGIDPATLVPGFNATQVAGQDAVVNAANAGTASSNAATSALQMLLNPNMLNASTNPNLQGAMDAATTMVFNQLQKNVLPDVIRGSVAAGQVGGSRQGVLENRAIQDATAEALRQTLALSNQNYQTGLGTMLSAINAAPNTLQTSLLPGQALLDVGGQMQAQTAAEAGAPITLAQAFQQLLSGNYGSTVTSTGQQQQTGTTAQQQATTQQSQQQTSAQETSQQTGTQQQSTQQTSQQNTTSSGTTTSKSTGTQSGGQPSLVSGALGGAIAGSALQAELFPNSMKTTTDNTPQSTGGETNKTRAT